METPATLREQVHQLVDDQRVEDGLLKWVYEVLNASLTEDGGWNALTAEQQESLLKSYEESFDEETLLDHETVKKRFQKGLSD